MTDATESDTRSASERHGPFAPSSPHPGWPWALSLGPCGGVLASAGVWLMTVDAGALVVRVAVGIALLAWAVMLLTPIAIVTTYAIAALWMRAQERRTTSIRWRVPCRELQHVGLRVWWNGRRLVFDPAQLDGVRLPLIRVSQVVHVVGVDVVLGSGAFAVLVSWIDRRPTWRFASTPCS